MSAMGDRRESNSGKKSRFGSQATVNADWSNASADLLKQVIVAAGNVNCAIRFGYSRDGGAYGIGIYEPGEAYTVWWTPHVDVDENLQNLLQYFEDFTAEPPSNGTGKNKAK